ncbi:MAG: mannosyltransferase [Winogradskyella sp.]|uniref:mannosyltransferase n=1 Tax=Winogradskyella sp. TaxID=1883156 RepID=UPI0017E6FA63|nr:mannosyltransferase [Winogradskyella sp.]MBT8245945.1 mannosyltransferase [Winogradskyella sp.]NNK21779.1 mannosyltransferase [Winogradskyella sp.]
MLLNLTFLKYNKTPLVCVLLSLILYATFAYDLVRTEATKLVLLYLLLFVIAYILKKSAGFNFAFLVLASVLIRLIFLPVIPNLSQDFYRFIWDGRMLFEGFNPYLYTPESFIQNKEFPIAQAQELYMGMGALSASHFTNYPPINQLCFYIAALFSGKSITGAIITLRLLIIAADIGTLYFGKKLLKALKLPSSRIWFYILNPFIIIELIGNLHFEGVMIFFLIWSLYLLYSCKWKLAAVILACSISVKLIPLMFLPIFVGWFWKKKKDSSTTLRMTNLILFYIIVIGTSIILFLPFFSLDFINNYSKTVGLWFSNFEFNASIYYIAREIGYWITDYNEIKTMGKILPVIALLIILYLSFFKRNTDVPKLVSSILLAFTCYLFLSTTVHPWYIATLVVLCVFTRYRFPLVWSVVIVLSYLSYLNIGTADKSENLWIIAIEYAIVFLVFIWEVILRKPITI